MGRFAHESENRKGGNLAKRSSAGTKAKGGTATEKVFTESNKADNGPKVTPETVDISHEVDASEDTGGKITDSDPSNAPENVTEESDSKTAEAVITKSPEPEPEKDDSPPSSIVHPQRRSIFLPLVLGGIIAATAGHITARTNFLDPFLPPGLRDAGPNANLAHDVHRLRTQLNDLKATVAALPKPQPSVETDLSEIEAHISAINSQLTANAAEISAISSQMGSVSDRQTTEMSVPSAAINAALEELRATAAAQQNEINQLLSDALLAKQDAAAAASTTFAHSAMARILSALDSGAPFTAALADLEQTGTVEIPDDLRRIATQGIAPLAVLQDRIPEAARAALAAARSVDENGGGLKGFLQRQLGMRSIEPQEGTDPDAVLSRIEAAVRTGRIADALGEVQTLPEASQDALKDWTEQAQLRHDAVSAAKILAERLMAL